LLKSNWSLSRAASKDQKAMDNRDVIVGQVEAWVRGMLDSDGKPAHGWLHTDRVRCSVLILARSEGVDPALAELAALLHDVGRTQPGPEDEHGARSAAMAEPLLADLPLAASEREAVLHAIRWHNSKRRDTLLLCILRDADMLDGLGAIGIMRAFMSKGHFPPYDPEVVFAGGSAPWPAVYASDQVLGQMKFYDWLNTETARRMAKDRIAFMRGFVAQLQREVTTPDV
jgi:uncharacterized protein